MNTKEKKCPRCANGVLAPIGFRQVPIGEGLKVERELLGCDECQYTEYVEETNNKNKI
jgi:ribosomal protein S27AE